MIEPLLAATAAVLLGQPEAPQAAPPAPTPESARQAVLVFTPDFFAEARPNTALDMINRLPGFDLSDGDGSRGFEGAVGNVLVNGARPASKSDTGSNVLNRTPASQVERIELIRGGAPGVDMQGYAVVANVILRRQTSRQQIITGNATLVEGMRTLFGGSYQYTARDGDRSWGVNLSDGLAHDQGHGLGTRLRVDATGAVLRDEVITEADSAAGSQAVRLNYAGPLFGGRIDVTARYGLNDFFRSGREGSATAERFNSEVNDGHSRELGLTYTRTLGEGWALESRLIHQSSLVEGVSINRTRLNGADAPEQAFAFSNDQGESIARALVRNESRPDLTFETGAELAYNVLDTRQGFSVGGVAVPLPSDTVRVEEVRTETFGRSTWRITPTLLLETGLRLERSTLTQSGGASQDRTLSYVKPRAQLTWSPRPSDQLRLRIEREVGQLSFADFAASADLTNNNVFGGNVHLEPEQRWISEAVYERRFWGEGIASVTLRHDEIEGVLDRIPLPGGLSARGNIGDGTLDRASLSITLPTGRIGIPGGRYTNTITWQTSEVTDPTTGQLRQISRIWPFDASVGFDQNLNSLNLQWGFILRSGYDDVEYNPDFRRAFEVRDVLHLYVEWKPQPSLDLRVQVSTWDHFITTRTAYADRISRDISYVEVRDVDPRTYWSLRLRKTV